MTEYRELGYDTLIKELDRNLPGQNVIDMLRPDAITITWDIFQLSSS